MLGCQFCSSWHKVNTHPPAACPGSEFPVESWGQLSFLDRLGVSCILPHQWWVGTQHPVQPVGEEQWRAQGGLRRGKAMMLKCAEYPSVMLRKESDLPLSVRCCILQMYCKSVLELRAINTFPEDTWRETKLACDLPQFCLDRSWLYLWFKMALLTQPQSRVGVLVVWRRFIVPGQACTPGLSNLMLWLFPLQWTQFLIQIQTGSFHLENVLWLLFMEMPSEKKHR